MRANNQSDAVVLLEYGHGPDNWTLEKEEFKLDGEDIILHDKKR